METTPTSETETVTMKAVVHTRFGAPADALELTERPVPSPGKGEVLVAVHAAGVAIGDWLVAAGLPYIARPMFGIRTPKEPVAGQELAGTVVGIGSGVTGFAVGDEVLGWGKGTLAEYAAIAAEALVPKPATLTFAQAAVIPHAGFTALQAVRDAGSLQPGQSVLVIGASGAVGTFAVQIAKALGAAVTGVASTRNLEMVGSIGADHIVDYTVSDVTESGERYDLIVDLAGNRPVGDLRRVLAPTGTLVIVGGSGSRWTMGYGRTLRAMAMSPFRRQTLTSLIAKPNGDDLATLAGMAAAGRVTPVIDRTFPLADTVVALEHIGSRHTQGKTVITIR